MAKDIFVSYSSDDEKIVERICELLEHRGISCWIAPRDVPPGRRYGEAILDAIESTHATLLVLSEHSNASVHVKNEVERAVSKGKTIFPVRIREVQLSRGLELFVANSQWVDAWEPPLERKMDQLAAAIRALTGESQEPVTTEPDISDLRRPGWRPWMKWVGSSVGTIVVATAIVITLTSRDAGSPASGSRSGSESGEGAPTTSPAAAPRSPLTADEAAALDEQIAGYSDQIRPVPLAVAGLQSDLAAVAERLWNERTYGPESARTVASAFRLYAASLLVSPEGTSQRGIQDALPWLRRSLQLEAGFEDRAELEAAHRFFMDMAVTQPAQVEMRVMLEHQIRIALIEASQAEVDAQVETALELITTIMQQRQPSQQ